MSPLLQIAALCLGTGLLLSLPAMTPPSDRMSYGNPTNLVNFNVKAISAASGTAFPTPTQSDK